MKAPTLLGAAALLAAAACQSALAQDAAAQQQLAAKPFTIVAPFPPGGPVDALARLLSTGLAERYKQTSVVENKPGANGNIGIDMVKRAAPDGHTLLVVPQGNLTINPTLLARPGYSVEADFAPVASLAKAANVIAVHPGVPAKTVQELVALSKKEDLSFAVTATGSAPHLAGVELARATGARWEYVPYKGGVQSIQDTVAGQTQVLMNGMLATYPHVQSGKLKLLGLSKGTRMPLAANVPTIAEQGVPGFETGTWQGVVVPAKTPEAVVQRLHEALITAIRSPEGRARLTGQGAEVVTMNPAETARFLTTERQRWQKVVQTAGLKLD